MAETFVDVSAHFTRLCSKLMMPGNRFVTLFWPKKVKASKLEEIHAKMVMKEAAPRQAADATAVKKPRLTAGVKTNGSSVPASSSARTNGKSHR